MNYSFDTIQPGDKISFHAARITHGNPVRGTVVSKNETWIELTLDHYIEGMANGWDRGENKSFRIDFCSQLKKIS